MRRISLSDLRKGDRLLLQELSGEQYVLEVTSAGHGSASGKRIGADGNPKGFVQRVKSWQLLCREGDAPVKDAGNLVPGDLVYDKSHRSGLQYCKAASIRGDHVGVVRWIEAREEWTKHPTLPTSYHIEYLGRADNSDDLQRFFARIKADRAAWEASPGRSGMTQVKGDERGTIGWREKQRRWQGEDRAPVKMHEPEAYRSSIDLDGKPTDKRMISVNLNISPLPPLPAQPMIKAIVDAPRSTPVNETIEPSKRQSWLTRITKRLTGQK